MEVKKIIHPHCQNDGLLFQFIISELLQAHMAVEQLHLDAKKEDALETLVALCGSIISQRPKYSLISKEGSLQRLNHYCDLYMHSFAKHVTTFNRLHRAIQASFQTLLILKDYFLSHSEYLKKEKNFHLAFKSLKKELKNAFACIAVLIPKYAKDENVLLFLLKYKDKLDPLLSPHKLKDLLEKKHTEGSEGMKKFLIARYQKRGFSHLLQEIEFYTQ